MEKYSSSGDKSGEVTETQSPLALWGPYVSERQWGTVREDYSEGGDAWNYFTHDQARSRVYRWGEDGIAGISDMHQQLCFALAVWNTKDAIIKERLFGLTNGEGNHGEDVKELYYYLDNTPDHSWMKYLYKYPQAEFPYAELLSVNKQRNKTEREYEIIDTGIFNDDKYFDIEINYAKQNAEDICIEIKIINRGEDEAPITLLPMLWFRNNWKFNTNIPRPFIEYDKQNDTNGRAIASHEKLGDYHFYFTPSDEVLMTNNETNTQKLYSVANASPFVKDAINDAFTQKNLSLRQELNQNKKGTKFSPVYNLLIKGKSSQSKFFRLTKTLQDNPFDEAFSQIFLIRKQEADDLYHKIFAGDKENKLGKIMRQAFAGLLWNKQYYQYDVEKWLKGDDNNVPPPAERNYGRNAYWENVKAEDVLSMPDKWEYPWFAAWDLSFHCIPFTLIDPAFAKNQLLLLCREWYMSPQGQIPAYEWDFNNVNPPTQAWAALQVYNIDKNKTGKGDIYFLKRIFQKLMLNFTWWANREDENENNIFSGGFLGLDNISIIDREVLPEGYKLEQVDATAWMGMFALNMMEMAIEISQTDNSFEDAATKFYEHFVLIAASLNETLWNDEENFFYDRVHAPSGNSTELKVRSIVGLSVLFNAAIIKSEHLENLPDLRKRMAYLKHYSLTHHTFLPSEQINNKGDLLVSLIHKDRLVKLLSVMLDQNEFLSPGGIRALSKYHDQHPLRLQLENLNYSINYLPAESDNNMFGGNSNWRGPVWMPLNYLIIRYLEKRHDFYGDKLQLPFPSDSGNFLNLKQIAKQLYSRIIGTFVRDDSNAIPVHGSHNWFYAKAENKDLLQFYEYYHGETAEGLGASHQTGWSSLVATIIAHNINL